MKRALAVVLALPSLFFGGTILLLGLFLQDYRCGDSCSVSDSDWRRFEHATEWVAMPWIGVGVLAMAVTFVVCVLLGRRWLALAALVAGAAATLAFVSWLSPGWQENVGKDPAPLLIAAAVFASGIAAAMLAKRSRARTG